MSGAKVGQTEIQVQRAAGLSLGFQVASCGASRWAAGFPFLCTQRRANNYKLIDSL